MENSTNDLCVCQLNECRLYLESPITLPCGRTICKSHIGLFSISKNQFDCSLCNEKHIMPEGGFQINITLNKIVCLNRHLNGSHKNAKTLFANLESILDHYTNNNGSLINHDNYIFEFFSKLRHKIDMHRDELFKQIQSISENLKVTLNSIEKTCKENAKSIPRINLDVLKTEQMPQWRQKLRMPHLDEQGANKLSQIINSTIDNINLKIKISQKDLLMNQEIEFIPNNDNSFGELLVNENLIQFSNDCGSCLRTFEGHQDVVRCVKIVEKEKKLISCSSDNTLKIWNLDTGECLNTLEGHTNAVNSLELISDEKIISCSDDKTIRIWDVKECKLLTTLNDEYPIFSLCLSPCKNILYTSRGNGSGPENGSISIWDISNKKKTKSFKAHEYVVTCIEFIENEKLKNLITSSDDYKIKLWNVDTFDCIQILTDKSEVKLIDLFNFDKLLTGSNDGLLKLWDLGSGKCLKVVDFRSNFICMKTLSKNFVIMKCNDSENFILYDLESNKKIQKFIGHKKNIVCVETFGKSFIVTGSADNKIKLWSL